MALGVYETVFRSVHYQYQRFQGFMKGYAEALITTINGS
jgi:hypothetical protein